MPLSRSAAPIRASAQAQQENYISSDGYEGSLNFIPADFGAIDARRGCEGLPPRHRCSF